MGVNIATVQSSEFQILCYSTSKNLRYQPFKRLFSVCCSSLNYFSKLARDSRRVRQIMEKYLRYKFIYLFTKKLIKARLGVSRLIYVNVDLPNPGFTYFNFFRGVPVKKTPCMFFFLEIKHALSLVLRQEIHSTVCSFTTSGF